MEALRSQRYCKLCKSNVMSGLILLKFLNKRNFFASFHDKGYRPGKGTERRRERDRERKRGEGRQRGRGREWRQREREKKK